MRCSVWPACLPLCRACRGREGRQASMQGDSVMHSCTPACEAHLCVCVCVGEWACALSPSAQNPLAPALRSSPMGSSRTRTPVACIHTARPWYTHAHARLGPIPRGTDWFGRQGKGGGTHNLASFGAVHCESQTFQTDALEGLLQETSKLTIMAAILLGVRRLQRPDTPAHGRR